MEAIPEFSPFLIGKMGRFLFGRQVFPECIFDGGGGGNGGPQIFKVPFIWKNAFFLYKNRHSFRKMPLLLEK